MKAPRFDYVRAESVQHALTLLARHGEEARILAGGQSLMPALNMRLSQPRLLIDINRLRELAGISLGGDCVRIGALARHAEVARSAIVAEHLPLIAEAMPHVANVAVRNRGTFGGSIALADPAAELPACVLALGGTIALESVSGRREVAAEEYFQGLYATARRPDELLTEVLIPTRNRATITAFAELARRHGDFALAGVAVRVHMRGGVVADARLAYFGSDDRPKLGRAVSAAITGLRLDEEGRTRAAQAVAGDLAPMSSPEASAALRLHLQRVLTVRALQAAEQRSATS
jgi:carbon-monoxide dehydrogenase medium subunit